MRAAETAGTAGPSACVSGQLFSCFQASVASRVASAKGDACMDGRGRHKSTHVSLDPHMHAHRLLHRPYILFLGVLVACFLCKNERILSKKGTAALLYSLARKIEKTCLQVF